MAKRVWGTTGTSQKTNILGLEQGGRRVEMKRWPSRWREGEGAASASATGSCCWRTDRMGHQQQMAKWFLSICLFLASAFSRAAWPRGRLAEGEGRCFNWWAGARGWRRPWRMYQPDSNWSDNVFSL